LETSLSKLAIAWCLLNQNVSPAILGALRFERLEEKLRAVDVAPLLTEDVQARLSAIYVALAG